MTLKKIKKTKNTSLDGGYGWVVVFGSFLTHIIIDGFIYSFGMLVFNLNFFLLILTKLIIFILILIQINYKKKIIFYRILICQNFDPQLF